MNSSLKKRINRLTKRNNRLTKRSKYINRLTKRSKRSNRLSKRSNRLSKRNNRLTKRSNRLTKRNNRLSKILLGGVGLEDYERKSIDQLIFTGNPKYGTGDTYIFRAEYEHDRYVMVKKLSNFTELVESIEKVLPRRFRDSPYTPLYNHLSQLQYISAYDDMDRLGYLVKWINKLYILINSIDLTKLKEEDINTRVEPNTKPNSYAAYNQAIDKIKQILADFVGKAENYDTPIGFG